MNLGTLRTFVSNLVGDPNFTRFTPTQYNDALNSAQSQFCYDSRSLYKDASTYTVVAATAAYSLPSDFFLERIVTHKGLQLKPVSRATLLRDNGDDWSDDVGTPTKFIIDPEQARRTLTLYPIPDTADAGANLILTYYPIPADMTSDTDSPFNSSSLMAQFHDGVAAYAAWLLLLYDTITPEIVAKRNELNKLYLEHVTQAIDRFGNTKSEPIKIISSRVWRP